MLNSNMLAYVQQNGSQYQQTDIKCSKCSTVTYPFNGGRYLCVTAVQHFMNGPQGKTNAGNLPVLISFNMVVCGVIIV